MKRFSLLVIVTILATMFGLSAVAMAAEKGKAAPKAMTMTGYVIDTQCATANQATLGEFVKTHTKECATAPGCAKSGYNLYSDGKLYKFDKASNKKVMAFLAKADSKLSVKADVMHGKGDMLKLKSITNAE